MQLGVGVAAEDTEIETEEDKELNGVRVLWRLLQILWCSRGESSGLVI